MNTDDLLCVGAVDNILVSSTIGRNKMLIPGEVISAIINGTDELLAELRGMGIGSWLNMEHFMLGIPTPDNQIRKTVKEVFGKETADGFFDCFIRSFISDSDFAFLKKCGVNILRVPFNYRLFIDDHNEPRLYHQCFAQKDFEAMKRWGIKE